MKKKILAFASAFTLTMSAVFATTPTDVPATIVTELHKDFKTANDVEWKTTDKFYKATFTSNGIRLEAFYGTDGNFLAVSRNLTADQLPLPLIMDTEKKTDGGSVTDLFEISSSNGTDYYMTVKKARRTISYKSTGDTWSRY
ncbi:MAG: hypothetical protein JWR61_2332 [Ferruginibacter sp.]|uniref:hypothetical protein n=1 Tax=Ferruginibacter sp. TaxID=1940288 RepID=UPI0026581BBF|nr:hypothetical protein [Ferruginibacter sp.]MDB5277377.1 hypothetical protein [Ferruginibacter sp.]